MRSVALVDKKYKGISHPDSLRWCHGTEGIEHVKIRKHRYPFYKYVTVQELKYVVCVCTKCNMHFYDKDSWSAPFIIRVYTYPENYFAYYLPVKMNGKVIKPKPKKMRNSLLGWVNQEMIVEDTRRFIDRVQ